MMNKPGDEWKVIIRTEEAAEILRDNGIPIGTVTLREGLKQRVFPFGDYIKMDGARDVFIVYPVMLQRWIKERTEA